MHIARQTPQEMVIVSGTRWLAAGCAVAAVGGLYFAITRHQLVGLFATCLLALFAVVMDLRKVFAFDGMQRVVRWKGRTLLKAESGEIRFDDITDIGTQSTRAGRNVPVYRLTIITPQATIPMAYSYDGEPDGYSTLRGQILEFVRPGAGSASRKPAEDISHG